MNTRMKAAMVTLFALVTLCTSASAQEMVIADLWNGEGVMVEDVTLRIMTEEYQWAECVSYQGIVYIPLHTAEQLLGASSDWDEGNDTLALTLDQTPFVQDRTPDFDRTEDVDYEEKLAALYEGWETGTVEVELYSGITLTLDGNPLPLYNDQGDSLYPLWFRDEFYLPIQTVSELMGYEILYVEGEPWTAPYQADEVFSGDFDILYEDYQPFGENPCIYLYKTPTAQQLEEAQNYLNQVEQIYIQTRDTLQQITTDSSGTEEAHNETLAQVAQQLLTIVNLEKPDFSPLIPIVYRDILSAVSIMVNDRIPSHISAFESDSIYNTSTVANLIDGTLLQHYYMIWGRLVSGQRILDGVTASELESPSDWAVAEVNQAMELGLVPTLTGTPTYGDAITRLQFAELVVNLVETAVGDITPVSSDTFTDTTNEAVLKAYAAGIVDGIGEGSFAPNQSTNREQIATMLSRAIDYISAQTGAELATEQGDLSSFIDETAVSSWAAEHVSRLATASIMKGTSDTTLDPQSTTTVEMSILLALRLFLLL